MDHLKNCQHPSFGELHLKNLSLDDLPALLEIEKRSHFTPWNESHFKGSLTNAHHVVGLTQNDQLIAYAVISLVAGEAELLLFVIDEKYQGKGIGRLFLEALVDILQNQASALFLEVRAGNIAAINLYEAVGFNQVGERPNYYSTPLGREDALVFAMDWSFL
ncbi:MAG: ribosomal protein S18-alanine N-acetyltransferase [Marinagarivorans sp.]|nr:ribosomal protein S18-alanine N-acetyltransferase [Marinagarivorans sp.]